MNDLLNQNLSEGDCVVLPSKGNFELHIGKIINFVPPKIRVIYRSKLINDQIIACVYPENLIKVDKTIANLYFTENNMQFDG